MDDKRYIADCRKFPSEKNCSLVISGRRDEVLRVAKRHAIEDHAHQDSPDLEKQISDTLTEE